MRTFKATTGNLVLILSLIKSCVRPGKHYQITIDECGSRSLKANSIYHIWVKQVSDFTGEDTKAVAARFKRDHGLPILLSGRHRHDVDKELDEGGYYSMDDYSQLLFISEMEVTRRFSTKDHNEYRCNIQAFWNDYGLNLQYKN